MESFANLFPPILIFVKIGILFFLLLYIVFAAVVVRQVRIMTEALRVGLEKLIKIVAFIHFLVSIFVFVLSILIL